MQRGDVASGVGATGGGIAGGVAGAWSGGAYAGGHGMDGLSALGPILVGIAAGIWMGSVAGVWAILRMRAHPEAGRAAAMHALLLPLAFVAFLVAPSVLPPMAPVFSLIGGAGAVVVLAVPAASAITSRRLTAPRITSATRFSV